MQKRTGTILSLLIALLCGVILLPSCEKDGPECYEPTTVNVSTVFKYIDTIRHVYYIPPDSTEADSLVYIARDTAIPRCEMKVLNESRPFQINGTQGSLIRIALNPAKDSIRYTFQKDTAVAIFDTITFYYGATVHFISNNCGYNNYYTLNDVRSTRNIFDSLRLVNNSVTNDVNVRHVEFYLKSKF